MFTNIAFSKTNYEIEPVVDELGIPWGATFVDDNTLLISEKEGRYTVINTSHKSKKSYDFPVKVKTMGQGGFLDIAKHPDFQKNNQLYFTYSKKIEGEVTTALAIGFWDQKNKQIKDVSDLFIPITKSQRGVHFGSRITFDGKGHLFFSIGDRGSRPNGQDLSTHAGSIIRLKLDGSVPKDNPFVNNPKARPEIWSYGHRNPQGLVYDLATNRLWEIEHGPRGGDEINLVEKGRNYGWATISYGKEYWGPIQVGEGTEKEGMEQPKKYYIPSIAPCGAMIYSGKIFKEWKGHLFNGALAKKHINIVEIKGSKIGKETRILEELEKRIRNVFEGPLGLIYFSTDNGEVFRLIPKA